MAQTGYRDFLTGKGFKDDEITYNNGNIYAKGKYFGSATPEADGKTYGDMGQLNQAYNSYNMNDAIDTFKTNLSKPQAQFSYDANSDPLYQNALGAAQRSAETAGNNATVRLGARGIGNSQQALTTENQIQQRATADVNSNILPQLMSQAYTRFHDNQVRDDQNNDRFLNLAGTYNNLGQQSFNNDRLTEADAAAKRKEHIDLAQMLSQQYGVHVDPKDDPALAYSQVAGLKPLNMRQYEDGRSDVKFNQGIAEKQLDNSTRQTNASIGNMNADNVSQAAARAEASGDKVMAQKFKVWELTGKAPAGITGVAEGTPLASKTTPTPADKNAELGQLTSDIDTMTVDNKKKFFKDKKADIISEYGVSGYNQLYNMYFDSYGIPVTPK